MSVFMWDALFQNKNIGHRVLGFLSSKEQQSLIYAVPKVSLFFESKRLEEMIRECYQLYPERTKGCKRPETSITLIPFSQNIPPARQQRRKTFQLGLIVHVLIPFPYRSGLGADHTATSWLTMYMAGLNHTNQSILPAFVIGLNMKDDFTLTQFEYHRKQIEMLKEAKKIIAFAKEKNIQVLVLPMIWGLKPLLPMGVASLVRSLIDQFTCHLRFPFGKARALLLQHDWVRMQHKEMTKSCRRTWHLCSDADVLEVDHYLKQCIDRIIKGRRSLCRLGGGYAFQEAEIRNILNAIKPTLTFDVVQQSLLLTLLLRRMDNLTRQVLAGLHVALSYFAEPTLSFNYAAEIPTLDHLTQRLNKGRDVIDISQAFVRETTLFQHQKYGVLRAHEAQYLEGQKCVVSSRKEQVVRRRSVQWPKGIQGQTIDSLSLESFRLLLANQSNHQLTPSQISSRWRQAGWGQDNFYRMVAQLPKQHFSFVCYFLSPRYKHHVDFNIQYFAELTHLIHQNPLEDMRHFTLDQLAQVIHMWHIDQENSPLVKQWMNQQIVVGMEAQKKEEAVLRHMKQLDDVLSKGWQLANGIFNTKGLSHAVTQIKSEHSAEPMDIDDDNGVKPEVKLERPLTPRRKRQVAQFTP